MFHSLIALLFHTITTTQSTENQWMGLGAQVGDDRRDATEPALGGELAVCQGTERVVVGKGQTSKTISSISLSVQ